MTDFDQKMMNKNETQQSMRDFFSGKTVGLTGGTGFLGQGLIEKLLRTCPDVQRIILLIRNKKDVAPKERLEQLTKLPAFDVLRKLQPNFAEKLQFIACDLQSENLGLNRDSIMTLRNDCDVFIHCAATLRFNEHLRIAFEMNVQCVRRLLAVFKPDQNKLRAFVHISTAYTHCDRKTINEEMYDNGIDYLDLESSLRWMSDDLVTQVTPELLGKRPNSYTLTKALAEDVIAREAGHLPVCIARPSMIIPALQEPLPGWCTNVYGPTAFMVAYSKGVVRTIVANKSVEADLIPVDFVVNGVLVAAMKTAKDCLERRFSLGYESDSGQSSDTGSPETESLDGESGLMFAIPVSNDPRRDIPVYHLNTSTKNPLLISDVERFGKYWYEQFPAGPIRTPYVYLTENRNLYKAMVFTMQTVPAMLMDAWLTVCRKNRKMTRLNKRIVSSMDVMEFFFTNTFRWGNSNVDQLRDELSADDQKLFNIDTSTFDWKDYFKTYVRGCNKYILKEDESQYESSKQTLSRLRFVDNCVTSAAALGLLGLATATGLTSLVWDVGSAVAGNLGLSFVI